MLHLRSETEPSWVAGVSAHLPELLLDHAHCEKKAASTAINLIFRYQPLPELIESCCSLLLCIRPRGTFDECPAL